MRRSVALLAVLLALPLRMAGAQVSPIPDAPPLVQETIALEPGQWWERTLDLPAGEFTLGAYADEGRLVENAVLTLAKADEWTPRLVAPIPPE